MHPDQNPVPPPTRGLSLHDVLFILYRYKRLILGTTAVGLLLAIVLFFFSRPVYESTAKLLVRYVVETSGLDVAGSDRRITNPDARGEAIMSAETEILTSWDLATDVAREPTAPGTTNPPGATPLSPVEVAQGLSVVVPRKGNTIFATYRGTDPERVVRILDQVVDRYLEKHLEVHRAANAHDVIARQADELSARLQVDEDSLRKLKQEGNVVSLAEDKTALSSHAQKLKEAVFAAQAERAEQEARIRELQKALGTTADVRSTNVVANVEPAVQERYRELVDRLAFLRRSQPQLLTQYTDKSPLVQHLQEQVTQLGQEKANLEKEHPGLAALAPHETVREPGTPGGNRQLDLISEYVKFAAVEARIQSLTNQVALVQNELTNIVGVESAIVKLERKKFLDETNFVYYSSALERARLDEALDPARMPNISVIQKPSTPRLDALGRLKRPAIPLAAGLILGIALSFLIELVFDQRVKIPSEVENRLGVSLVLTVPDVKGLGNAHLDLETQAIDLSPGRLAQAPILPSLLTAGNESKPPASEKPSPDAQAPTPDPSGPIPSLSPWNAQHALRPYFEALRDRLSLSFQLGGLQHKPKLVAVTGCTPASGATTIAAGLAAALSDTGDGNVLLVDMNLGKSAAHPFFQGRPASSLANVLEPDTRDEGQVQGNLYLASVNNEGDPKRPLPLPTRLHKLMQKMRASDYDYIIFDMPPISETSATVPLSASMDKVLLVIEAATTSRREVKRAATLLRQCNANVSGVFNRQRQLAPNWLLGEG